MASLSRACARRGMSIAPSEDFSHIRQRGGSAARTNNNYIGWRDTSRSTLGGFRVALDVQRSDSEIIRMRSARVPTSIP